MHLDEASRSGYNDTLGKTSCCWVNICNLHVQSNIKPMGTCKTEWQMQTSEPVVPSEALHHEAMLRPHSGKHRPLLCRVRHLPLIT